jgi:hypothetical protein
MVIPNALVTYSLVSFRCRRVIYARFRKYAVYGILLVVFTEAEDIDIYNLLPAIYVKVCVYSLQLSVLQIPFKVERAET